MNRYQDKDSKHKGVNMYSYQDTDSKHKDVNI
jgi:hypothetical protein